MKRRITVKSKSITISAVVDTGDMYLSREEVEALRDDVADRLMLVASQARYIGEPLSRIKVG